MSSQRQRLQKVLSQAGVCSRRRAEELMRQGRVLLNGRPASPGDQGDPLRDRILGGWRAGAAPAQELTLLLHKPGACTAPALIPADGERCWICCPPN